MMATFTARPTLRRSPSQARVGFGLGWCNRQGPALPAQRSELAERARPARLLHRSILLAALLVQSFEPRAMDQYTKRNSRSVIEDTLRLPADQCRHPVRPDPYG